ncbi:MAG: 16S rRNA methyltransferase [Bifidobacteriaceae bacterium]|nr:16S rRNA methyltransferase [Bifidobacteriaceae bacterium]
MRERDGWSGAADRDGERPEWRPRDGDAFQEWDDRREAESPESQPGNEAETVGPDNSATDLGQETLAPEQGDPQDSTPDLNSQTEAGSASAEPPSGPANGSEDAPPQSNGEADSDSAHPRPEPGPDAEGGEPGLDPESQADAVPAQTQPDGARHREEGRGWSLQRPSERPRYADPARRAAFDLLREVDQGAYANLVLPQMLAKRGIYGRDAAFATELAYGAIRMRGQYDAVIAKAAGRTEIDPPVWDALRLGVHQIAALRVPDHAAVAETVAVARESVGTGPAGFVNAVLRTILEAGYEAMLQELAPAEDLSVDNLALRYSQPPWVVRATRQALIAAGRPAEDLAAVLASANTQPPVTLAARPGLISRPALAEQVEERTGRAPSLGELAPTAVLMARGAPGDLPAVRDGRAAVQDEGSQLVAWLLAEAPVGQDEGEWLDLCAGPGGKAALLAAIGRERGARLTANEPQPHRADLVRQAVRQLGDVVRLTQLEASQLDGQFDRVLVDAPCTGLGALRRRPEARWRHTPADLATLGPLQRDLLRAGLERTKPGGAIVYATCSPHVAETRLVVDDVLRGRQDAMVEDLRALPLVPGDAVAQDGMAQLWTDRHGTDAMFFALIRRL